MTFKARFLSLAIFNSALLVGFYVAIAAMTPELSKRLIDLSLENKIDQQTFLGFIAFLLVAFVGNFSILSIGRTEFTKNEVEEMVNLLT